LSSAIFNRAAAQGLIANPGLQDLSIFKLCKTTIQQQLELSRRHNHLAVAKKRTYDEASAVVDEEGKALAETSEFERQNAHYFIEFALGLLHIQLKRSSQRPGDAASEMLDLLSPALLECLKGRQDKVIELSLKVISLVVPRKLPSLTGKSAKGFTKRVFEIMSESGSATDLTQVNSNPPRIFLIA
jgi:hypothetical protein